MLSYAFKVLKEQGYKNIETEEFDNVAELLSEILIRGLKIEIKRGLFKNYESESDTISMIRGKINISSTVKNQTLLNSKIVCDYDEFTENTYLNFVICFAYFFIYQSSCILLKFFFPTEVYHLAILSVKC